MENHLRKYSTSVCEREIRLSAIFQSNLSSFDFQVTHLTVTHSVAFRKISVRLPHLNTGWKTTVVLCWPGYTFITLTGTGKEVIVQAGACAVTLFSDHLIIIRPVGTITGWSNRTFVLLSTEE